MTLTAVLPRVFNYLADMLCPSPRQENNKLKKGGICWPPILASTDRGPLLIPSESMHYRYYAVESAGWICASLRAKYRAGLRASARGPTHKLSARTVSAVRLIIIQIIARIVLYFQHLLSNYTHFWTSTFKDIQCQVRNGRALSSDIHDPLWAVMRYVSIANTFEPAPLASSWSLL